MLTNPSPNARTPRAVSRRQTLRRLRWELLIGGAAEGIYLKNLATHSGAQTDVSGDWSLGGSCRLCPTMVVVSLWYPRRSRLVGDFRRESCQRAHQSDGREDLSRSQFS